MRTRWSLPATVAVMVLLTAPVRAADPAAKCEAAKNKTAGKYSACLLSATKTSSAPCVGTSSDSSIISLSVASFSLMRAGPG